MKTETLKRIITDALAGASGPVRLGLTDALSPIRLDDDTGLRAVIMTGRVLP